MVSPEGATVFRSPDASPAKERVGKGILNHVLIIPDNNRTWARNQGLTTREGYDAGARRIVEAGTAALSVPGLNFLTVHLASRDNIQKRPPEELKDLWGAVKDNMIDTGLPELVADHNVKLRIIGDMTGVRDDVREGFTSLVDQSKDNTGKSLSFVIGYDKDQEMRDALQAASEAGVAPTDWDSIKAHLYLPRAGVPDISAIIRAGDEKRTSGIFPQSSADAEHLYYEQAKWPEFTPDVFRDAVGLLSERRTKGGA